MVGIDPNPLELKSAISGIRTQEANAADLKSAPFDHSGKMATDGNNNLPDLWKRG